MVAGLLNLRPFSAWLAQTDVIRLTGLGQTAGWHILESQLPALEPGRLQEDWVLGQTDLSVGSTVSSGRLQVPAKRVSLTVVLEPANWRESNAKCMCRLVRLKAHETVFAERNKNWARAPGLRMAPSAKAARGRRRRRLVAATAHPWLPEPPEP